MSHDEAEIPEIVGYAVLQAATAKDLERAVMPMIMQGWRPIGGVSLASIADRVREDGEIFSDMTFAQAMVKLL
jgi:hypothetical protein